MFRQNYIHSAHSKEDLLFNLSSNELFLCTRSTRMALLVLLGSCLTSSLPDDDSRELLEEFREFHLVYRQHFIRL